MRRLTSIFALSCLLTSCATSVKLFTVDNSKVGVKYGASRGTIFKDNYPSGNFLISDADSTKRWTPNQQEIELAERILKEQIKGINKSSINQSYDCPVIHRHLNAYFRQYIGIRNDKGQRIIHINFSWDKLTLLDRIAGNSHRRLDFTSEYLVAFDGCCYYWRVNVNLDEKKLTDLGINGVA